jgi:hypothetical protein
VVVAPRALFAVAAIAATVAVAPAPAAASSDCAKAVVADWRDNGRIDKTYPPQCYRAAVDALPEDVRVYSSAQNDITRALQDRVGKSAASGVSPDSSGSSPYRLPLLVIGTLAFLMLTAGLAADVVGRR